MYRKILFRKIILLFLLMAGLMVFQYFLLDRITVERIVQFIILDVSILIGFYSFRGFELDTIKSFNASLVSALMGGLFGSLFAVIIIIAAYSSQNAFTRWDAVATLLFATASFPVFSTVFYSMIQNLIPPNKCYVIGSEARYGAIMQAVSEASHGKVTVVEWIEQPTRLNLTITRKNHCDVILVADWRLYQQMRDEVNGCLQKGYQKKFITNMAEHWLRRIPLELAEEYGDYYEALFSDVHISKRKRLLDIFLAILVGTVGLPFIVLSGLLVMLTSGFPLIFKHERVGMYGEIFMFYKFRSLKPVKQSELAAMQNPNGTIEQRVTAVGKGLRKIRFDEFPQVINILNGSMSLVGPRPEMTNYHEQFRDQIPFYTYRNAVRPGITGWAQINFSHTSTLEEYRRKTEYDLYYIKNESILLDLQIMLMTIEAMLGMRGSR